MGLFWLCILFTNAALITCSEADSEAIAKSESSGNGTSTAEASASAEAYSDSDSDSITCPEEDMCPDNEEYSSCIQSMSKPRFCSEKGQTVKCEKIDPKDCTSGCVCKIKYLRNNNGTCVPEAECNTSCADTEVLVNCPSICDSQYCNTHNGTSTACPQPTKCPAPVCKCRHIYRRADNGSCIPTRDCPPFDCSAKPNEEYNACPPLCPSKDCGLPACTGVCPFRIGIVLTCNPKCTCKTGYCRDNGTCVSCSESPNVCPANETFNECIQGECRPLNCSQIGEPIACPRIDPEYCESGCICKENFYRAENGECVPEDQCPGRSCPTNEEFSDCIQGVCRAQNCSQKGQPIACPLIAEGSCKKGCVCKEDFLRDDTGCCIPEDQCPSNTSCGPNEVEDPCPANCESEKCPTKLSTLQCDLPEDCPPPGCKCAFNYRYAENGTCIPTRDCPPFDCSAKPNEEYNACPPLCPSEDCGLPACTGVCLFRIGIVLNCNPTCTCKTGYCRDNGTCVSCSESPNVCPANETFNECIQGECRPLNCSQIGEPIACPRIDPEYCESGCICKENFYRAENGECVPEDQCPGRSCPTNEEFSDCIQGVCRAQNCSQKGQPIACPSIAEGSCKKGCVCKEDFLRDDTGCCIPEDQCPSNTSCGPNEVEDPCPANCESEKCPTKDNSTLQCDLPEDCPPLGCKCAFNYRYAKNGTCIPTRDCPPFDCSAKPNEEYNACPPLCPSEDCGLPACTGVCPFRIGIVLNCNPTCTCKTGYCRDNGTCVSCSESPNVCPANETFNECIQGKCRPLNCSQIGEHIACPRIDPEYCESGCICKENFYRAENGECVPEDQCPGRSCPTNEEFSDCIQGVCRAQNCSQKGQPIACPSIAEGSCKKGCVCKEDFLRDDTGCCIPEDQCPSNTSCGPNEVEDPCPANCESEKCPTKDNSTLQCDLPEDCPAPGCKCAFNYRYAKNGTCIPTRDCPPFDCSARPNEEYDSCPPLCPTDDCSEATPTGDCPYPGRILIVVDCNPACRCIKGYWRKNGTCVPYEECPNACKSNEEYTTCTGSVCRPQNCTEMDTELKCPKVPNGACASGCVCKENYYRNSDNECVPSEECNYIPSCTEE